jgi:hypothetical protein
MKESRILDNIGSAEMEPSYYRTQRVIISIANPCKAFLNGIVTVYSVVGIVPVSEFRFLVYRFTNAGFEIIISTNFDA